MIRPTATGLLFLIALLIVTAVPSDTYAFDYRLYKGGFGVKGGFIYVSTVHLRDKSTGVNEDYRTKAGLTGGVFFDIPLHRKTMLGLDIELYDIQVQGDREKLMNFELNIKHTVAAYKHNRMAVRLGAGVGYGYLAEVGSIEQANLMVLKAFTEVLFLNDPKIAWLVEGAVMMAPYGRTNDYKISSNPFLMIRGGARF